MSCLISAFEKKYRIIHYGFVFGILSALILQFFLLDVLDSLGFANFGLRHNSWATHYMAKHANSLPLWFKNFQRFGATQSIDMDYRSDFGFLLFFLIVVSAFVIFKFRCLWLNNKHAKELSNLARELDNYRAHHDYGSDHETQRLYESNFEILQEALKKYEIAHKNDDITNWEDDAVYCTASFMAIWDDPRESIISLCAEDDAEGNQLSFLAQKRERMESNSTVFITKHEIEYLRRFLLRLK